MARDKQTAKKSTMAMREKISKPSLRRLARRAGVQRISGDCYDVAREALREFLKEVIGKTVQYTDSRRAKTVTAMDVIYGLKACRRMLYV